MTPDVGIVAHRYSFTDVPVPEDSVWSIACVVGRGVHVHVEQRLLCVLLLACLEPAAGQPGLPGQGGL